MIQHKISSGRYSERLQYPHYHIRIPVEKVQLGSKRNGLSMSHEDQYSFSSRRVVAWRSRGVRLAEKIKIFPFSQA
ncbi:hypothetical protein RP20_CCG008131 [Aedes albopictus]|nr:hypothetical protein RP20_CCG008131 [Aedes albopictus]